MTTANNRAHDGPEIAVIIKVRKKHPQKMLDNELAFLRTHKVFTDLQHQAQRARENCERA